MKLCGQLETSWGYGLQLLFDIAKVVEIKKQPDGHGVLFVCLKADELCRGDLNHT